MRTKTAVLGLVLGFTLSSSVVAYAAFTKASPNTRHAYAKYGTWASCTAGSTSAAVAIADTWVQSNQPTTNNGAGANLNVGRPTTAEIDRTLVLFPAPTIPSGCTVTKSEIRLRTSGTCTTARNINMHPIDAPWVEGNGASGVTWNTQPGTFGNTLLAATTVGGAGCVPTTTYLWSFVGSGGYPWENGVEFRDSSETSGTFQHIFASRTNGTTASRPTLVVFYA